MASVDLLAIRKRFGSTDVLHDVSLSVAHGEFLAILGPSGCGKSTLLRILAGLEGADAGEVLLGGRPVGALPAKARDLAMVFQSYALYPYMTVAENIGLPLRMRRLSAWGRAPLLGRLLPAARVAERGIAADVDRIAGSLGLDELLNRRPAQLSGGQRQRVALARAMVRQPAAFLMDEPLSNLDARLRGEARAEIAALHRRLSATVLYVTHDQAEAMALADRVAVMQAGRVLQVGPPQSLYDEPCSLDVARFVGNPPMNAIPARIAEGGAVHAAGVELALRASVAPGPAVLGVRPEALHPTGHGLPARLLRIERLGAEALLHAVLPDGTGVTASVKPSVADGLRTGTDLHLAVGRALLFDTDGGRVPVAAREPAHA